MKYFVLTFLLFATLEPAYAKCWLFCKKDKKEDSAPKQPEQAPEPEKNPETQPAPQPENPQIPNQGPVVAPTPAGPFDEPEKDVDGGYLTKLMLPDDIDVNGYPVSIGAINPYREVGVLSAEQELALTKSNLPQNYCQVYRPEPVTVDGIKRERFKIPDPKYLRCFSIWEEADKDIAMYSRYKMYFGDRNLLPEQNRWFAPKRNWKVLAQNTSWTLETEKQWQTFVTSMGKALESGQCNSIDTCLLSSANTMPDRQDDEHMYDVHYSDCADFPYYLRAYFSFKMKMPFSFVIENAPNPIPERVLKYDDFGMLLPEEQQPPLVTQPLTSSGGIDMRYTREGNYPVNRLNIPHSGGAVREFQQTMRNLQDWVSSATMRMYQGNPASSTTLPDFYPPFIGRESVKPGTVFYDAGGHVAIVYEVTESGEVKMMDAHPDNSVTRKSFNREFKRSNPNVGSGFKNWRPFEILPDSIVIDKYNPEYLQKGRIRFFTDEMISDWSDEQYFGNKKDLSGDWKLGKHVYQGRELPFVEFVRARLANGNFKLDPVVEVKKELQAMCMSLKDRVEAVQVAVDKGIDRFTHPENYPKNIYGADGEWESYSTPGRDLRLRTKALEISEMAKEFIFKWLAKDPYTEYRGQNLKLDLIRAYHEVNASCRIEYKNSVGQPVRMSMGAALRRLPKISFDPYFCPEMRWGATSKRELATCTQAGDKLEWYELTQFLRNKTEKDTTELHGYSLYELQSMSQDANLNISRPDQYDILKQLEAL